MRPLSRALTGVHYMPTRIATTSRDDARRQRAWLWGGVAGALAGVAAALLLVI